ncbi:hypothetical protein T484DRAFT_1915650 [Baffinella frigidus]|nr:hypothetical protein T484DRAFT_1915650 [Cryptophyta sp. CCMP2293]
MEERRGSMASQNSSARLAASSVLGGLGDREDGGITPQAPWGSPRGGRTAKAAPPESMRPGFDTRLVSKRQDIFKSKFERDERIVNRNKALKRDIPLQGDEIRALRHRNGELEQRLEHLAPLEGLLEFMAGDLLPF